MYRDFAIGMHIAAALVLPTALARSEPLKPVAANIPAGEYRLDSAHASLIFRPVAKPAPKKG